MKVANYNHFQNMLRLFDVLTIFPFTTSETMCDHFLSNGVQFGSRKTKN